MQALEEERLLDAVVDLLTEKGHIVPAEIAQRMAITDQASPRLGAKLVAKAWLEPDFRELLLADGSRAAESVGIAMRGAPPLGVLEDKADLHHLVVCTLCSCYPRAVLGYPPFWFKSPAYRARAVREPRAVLRSWGTELPPTTRIRVVDSTADYRWMVLPLRPAGTEGLDEEALATLVDEGDLIGVTIPSACVAP